MLIIEQSRLLLLSGIEMQFAEVDHKDISIMKKKKSSELLRTRVSISRHLPSMWNGALAVTVGNLSRKYSSVHAAVAMSRVDSINRYGNI